MRKQQSSAENLPQNWPIGKPLQRIKRSMRQQHPARTHRVSRCHKHCTLLPTWGQDNLNTARVEPLWVGCCNYAMVIQLVPECVDCVDLVELQVQVFLPNFTVIERGLFFSVCFSFHVHSNVHECLPCFLWTCTFCLLASLYCERRTGFPAHSILAALWQKKKGRAIIIETDVLHLLCILTQSRALLSPFQHQ